PFVHGTSHPCPLGPAANPGFAEPFRDHSTPTRGSSASHHSLTVGAAGRGYRGTVTDVDAELVAAATAARDRSYAPYSNFRMGAAVRCADGTIVPGALVENVSLGLAMCAERAALFATVARGLRPVALALVADRTSGALTFPCGACVQVALELAGPELT